MTTKGLISDMTGPMCFKLIFVRAEFPTTTPRVWAENSEEIKGLKESKKLVLFSARPSGPIQAAV
jgi:hypothetical protein